jgi:hypothetical protein
MQETLLDFDAADASGDQGAVTPLNLKTSDIKLHITEISAMMREWSMPIADALALSLSKSAPAGTGAFRVERKHREKARNERAIKSLKINNPANSLIRRS